MLVVVAQNVAVVPVFLGHDHPLVLLGEVVQGPALVRPGLPLALDVEQDQAALDIKRVVEVVPLLLVARDRVLVVQDGEPGVLVLVREF